MDAERIIVRQAGKLDWDYIHAQLTPLAELKESPEILEQLEQRRLEFGTTSEASPQTETPKNLEDYLNAKSQRP